MGTQDSSNQGGNVRSACAVIRLLPEGLPRVLNGQVGMTFIVNEFTEGAYGPVAHVRDYRFVSDASKFQVWSLAGDQYEVVLRF